MGDDGVERGKVGEKSATEIIGSAPWICLCHVLLYLTFLNC